MGADQHHDWREAAASALDWWHAAGVDCLVEEEPRDWLARTRPAIAPVSSVEESPAPVMPDTLTGFIEWRIGSDAPEHGMGTLIGAEGDPASGLMIVVDYPEGETLLDGAPGRLFDRMLAAIGRDRASIYLAPLCAIRPTGGRIPPELAPRLTEIMRRHIRLAAPKRVLFMGQAPSRALIGTDGSAGAGSLHAVNLEGTSVDCVASLHPRFLLERPALKAEAWRDLQVLTGGMR